MQPLKESYQILSTFKPSEVDHFHAFIAFENSKLYKDYLKLSGLILKSGIDNLPDSKVLNKLFPSPQVYRRVNEFRELLEKFIVRYIIPQEPYNKYNEKTLFLRYLRNNKIMDVFAEEYDLLSSEIEKGYSKDDFRSLFINILNESRRNFFHVYYNEKNYRFKAITSNYTELEKIKGWINSSHLLNKIFYDFSLRAAHKIEAETLQKSVQRTFEPEFFDIKEYLKMLNSKDIPLVYKTYILDILEGSAEVSAKAYHQAAEDIFYSNYHEANESVKNNILILLISSSKIPQDLKGEYYKELVDLRSTLSPGIINKYILEHLEEDTTRARKEFERLRLKATQDPENDLNAIEGILLSREGLYEESINLLNKVIIYQQDNMYFDVNLALLKCFYELKDIEVAYSKWSNLKVYYHKYRDHLSAEKDKRYKHLINDYKRMLEGKD